MPNFIGVHHIVTGSNVDGFELPGDAIADEIGPSRQAIMKVVGGHVSQLGNDHCEKQRVEECRRQGNQADYGVLPSVEEQVYPLALTSTVPLIKIEQVVNVHQDADG